MKRRGFGNNASGLILDHLRLLQGFVRETKEERVTVVDALGD